MFLSFLSDTSWFGGRHIFCCILAIAAIVVACIFGRKLSLKQAITILLIIGIASEVIKIGYFVTANEAKLGGYLPKTDLPFHLCSIQIIFMFILKLSNNEKLKKLLLSFMIPTCLVGGLAAILIPTSSAKSVVIIACQYYTYHAAIMWFAVYLLMSKEITFTFKDYINVLLFLCALGFVAIYVNSILYDVQVAEAGESKINFMYVVGPPQDGLPLLNKNHGWGVYIIHYAFVAWFAITLCFIKPIINHFKKKEPAIEGAEVE